MLSRSELPAILQGGYASITDADERKKFRDEYRKLDRKRKDHVLARQSPADLTRLAEAFDKMQHEKDIIAERPIIQQAQAIKQGLASKSPLSDTDLMTQAQTMFEQGANSDDDFVRVRAWELKIGLSASNNQVSITKGKTENGETKFIVTTGSAGRDPITTNVSRAELEKTLQTSQAYAAIQVVTSPPSTNVKPVIPVPAKTPVAPVDNSAILLQEKFTDTKDKQAFLIALSEIKDPEKKKRVLMQQRAIDLKALARSPGTSNDDRDMINKMLQSTQNVTLSSGQLCTQAEKIMFEGKNNSGVVQQAEALGVRLHGSATSVSVAKNGSGFMVTVGADMRHAKTEPIPVDQAKLEQLVRDNLTPASAATISVMSVPSESLAGNPSQLRKPPPPPPGARAPSSTEPPRAAVNPVVQAPSVQQPPRPSTQPIAGATGVQRLAQNANEFTAKPDQPRPNPQPVRELSEAQRFTQRADGLSAELEKSKDRVVASNGSSETLGAFRACLDSVNKLRTEICQFGSQSSAKEDKISANNLVKALDAKVAAAVKVVDNIINHVKSIGGSKP